MEQKVEQNMTVAVKMIRLTRKLKKKKYSFTKCQSLTAVPLAILQLST